MLGVYALNDTGPPLDQNYYWGVLIAFLGPFFVGRNRPADRELELTDGKVRILSLVPVVIRSSDVRAALSTTREGGRVVVGVVLETHGPEPVLFEFDSAADAAVFRQALGIRELGYGTVEWERAGLWVAIIGRTCLVVWASGVGYFLDAERSEAVLPFTLLYFSVLFYLCVLVMKLSSTVSLSTRMLSFTSKIALDPAAIHFIEPLGKTSFPFERILDARVEHLSDTLMHRSYLYLTEELGGKKSRTHRFVVETTTLLKVGTTCDELELIVSMVQSAARRARGLEGSKNPAADLTRPILPSGEDAARWVQRLDQMGSLLRGTSQLAFTEDDLWNVFSDENVEPLHRLAAGRILFARDPRATERMRWVLERIPRADERKFIALCAEPSPELARRLAAAIPG